MSDVRNVANGGAGMGRYTPAGWEQWPGNRDYSFQFARALGAAQEGASTVSECFLTASRIVLGDDESWHAAWRRMGEANLARAEAADNTAHAQTAAMNRLRAANYFRSAEFFLPHDDPRRLELLDLIESCTQSYLDHVAPGHEVVRIPYEGGAHLDAYFIPAPDGRDRKPVAVCFGGLDEFKDELVHEMVKHAFPRGLSLLLVDLPGQGGTLRRQKLTARLDTEVPVTACVDWLLHRDDVDADRLALYGASLGGYYAPRAAAFEHRFRCVVSDGAMWKPEWHKQRKGANVNAIGVRHLHWVLGVPGVGTEEGLDALLEEAKGFNLEGVLENIRCPYLIVEGEHDFAGPHQAHESFDYAKRHGLDVTLKMFTAEETGASHCQIDNPTLGQEFICDWIADRLGIDQSALRSPTARRPM